jgi:hypothetical protein
MEPDEFERVLEGLPGRLPVTGSVRVWVVDHPLDA